jgi:photosystem II stability/assembly factor-like uncharacterized protein
MVTHRAHKVLLALGITLAVLVALGTLAQSLSTIGVKTVPGSFSLPWQSWQQAMNFVPKPSQWKELGPNSGAFDTILVDAENPSIIFAAGRFSGIYRSTDGGNTWSRSDNGMDQYFVTSLIADPIATSTLYAVAGGDLFISNDTGYDWYRTDVCVGNSTVLAAGSDPNGDIYLGCGNHLMLSRDDGRSWVTSYPGVQIDSVDAIGSSGSALYLLASGSNGVYIILRSLNGGDLWTPFTTDWGVTRNTFHPIIAVDPNNTSVLFVNAPQGVMRSDDGGADWTLVVSDSYGVTGGYVTFDPYNSSVVYAGRVLLYVSNDSGRTFHSVGSWNIDCVTTPIPVYHADIGSIALLGDRIILGTDGGIDISDDGGESWTCHSAGLMNGLTYSVAVDPFDPIHLVVTRQDYYPAQSFDAGKTWQTIYQIQSEWGQALFDPNNRGVLYIASGGGVWKSNDSGKSFELSSKGLPTVPYPSSPQLVLDPTSPNVLWLSIGTLGLFKSSDGAAHWKKISQFSYSGEVDFKGGSVYAVAASGGIGGVWKSTDGGTTWSRLDLPLNESYFEVKVSPSDSKTVIVVGNSLHISTDGGLDFTTEALPADLLQPQVGSFGATPFVLLVQSIGNSSRIILASAEYGRKANVYESFDLGETWQSITGNLNSTMVTSISFNPTYPIQLLLATFGEGVVMENVQVPLVVNYSVQQAGVGYTPPRITFVSGGNVNSIVLNDSPTTVNVDWGTLWLLTAPDTIPPGSGRWVPDSPTSGVATQPIVLNVSFSYQQSPGE